MLPDQFLPDTLPESPLPLFAQWFNDARRLGHQPNPDAMVLATVGESERPSARVVLCKQINERDGFIVFYTNADSRKGREISAHPRAAVVFHWDHLHRQVRIEGPVIRSPANESDAYFASRALASRIGAWASLQSQPLASRAALAAQVKATEARFGVQPASASTDVPRPPNWGGNRIWIDYMELWMEGAGRVHDRAAWQRSLQRSDEFSFTTGQWSATRLNP
jgi:pyridoxamine 5'-phosphate oxidase